MIASLSGSPVSAFPTRPAGFEELVCQCINADLPHTTDAAAPQQPPAFTRDLIETDGAGEVPRDARSGLIHEAEVGAADQQDALTGSLEKRDGTGEILWDALSGLVHESKDVAGRQLPALAGLLVQARGVL